jgi:hypothetical protein
MAAPGREQAACRGEEGAVTRSQSWALDLTAQNIELVAHTINSMSLTCAGPPLPISSFSREAKMR